jgi:hypothetical protein
MKRFIMALSVLVAAVGLLIPAGMAQAATTAAGPAPAQAATSSCSRGVNGVVGPTSALLFWTENSCNDQGRTHIKCEFSNFTTHNYNGGWVRPVGLDDVARCAPGSSLIAVAWQWRIGPGHPVHTIPLH